MGSRDWSKCRRPGYALRAAVAEKAVIEKIKLEWGETHTQSELLKFGRAQGKGLAPFNPDRWEPPAVGVESCFRG